MRTEGEWVCLAITMVLAANLIGALIWGSVSKADLRSAAIEHGCAAYDQQTGEWGWK